MKLTITNTSKSILELGTTALYNLADFKNANKDYNIEILIPTGGAVSYIEGLFPASTTTSRPLVVGTPFTLKAHKLSDVKLITATTQEVFVTIS